MAGLHRCNGAGGLSFTYKHQARSLTCDASALHRERGSIASGCAAAARKGGCKLPLNPSDRAGQVMSRRPARCLMAATRLNPIASAHSTSSSTSITLCPLSTSRVCATPGITQPKTGIAPLRHFRVIALISRRLYKLSYNLHCRRDKKLARLICIAWTSVHECGLSPPVGAASAKQYA